MARNPLPNSSQIASPKNKNKKGILRMYDEEGIKEEKTPTTLAPVIIIIIIIVRPQTRLTGFRSLVRAKGSLHPWYPAE